MSLSPNKTKIICTLGPASESVEILYQMIMAGMNVARLNFAHNELSWHKGMIEKIRQVSARCGMRITILADLPGPKMRIDRLEHEPIVLVEGAAFTLSSTEMIGTQTRVSMSFKNLPHVVKSGDCIFMNDGAIKLLVVGVSETDVECKVEVGGELWSHKGLNFPGIQLGISAFTDHDRECMKFALENGADALSQSFVESAADIDAVRQAASELGYKPFIIAKIERLDALKNIDEILNASDGIMVARGDLGVETPIENIATVQKKLIRKACNLGKPVITATQMLESMVEHIRPTRAEVTDVANAILDGTDCVMLSEESAMGKYPVESIKMLVAIAVSTEPSQYVVPSHGSSIMVQNMDSHLMDLISINIQQTVAQLRPIAVLIPTNTGHTARMVSRFKLPVWIAAVSLQESHCHDLQFSYGVSPVLASEWPKDWNVFANSWALSEGLPNGVLALTEGPSLQDLQINPRLEIIQIMHDKGITK